MGDGALGFVAANSERATPSSVWAVNGLSAVSGHVWIKTAATPAGFIFNNGTNGSSTTTRLGLRSLNTNFRISGRRVDADAGVDCNSATVPAGDTIYSVGFSIDYSTGAMIIYVNGVSDGTATLASTGTSAANNPIATVVGARADGGANYFGGAMQDLAIWFNTVLTSTDFANLARGARPSTIGTVDHWYKLDEATSGALTAGQALDSGAGNKALSPQTNAPDYVSNFVAMSTTAATLAGFTGAATIAETLTPTVAATWPELVCAASVAETLTSTAAATWPEWVCAASMTSESSGETTSTVAATWAGYTGAATVGLALSCTGDGQLAGFTCAATVNVAPPVTSIVAASWAGFTGSANVNHDDGTGGQDGGRGSGGRGRGRKRYRGFGAP